MRTACFNSSSSQVATMPAEQPAGVLLAQSLNDFPAKLCSSCRTPLARADDDNTVFCEDGICCGRCRAEEALLALANFHGHDGGPAAAAAARETPPGHARTVTPRGRPVRSDATSSIPSLSSEEGSPRPSSSRSLSISSTPGPTLASAACLPLRRAESSVAALPTQSPRSFHPTGLSPAPRPTTSHISAPDPLMDITRLRVRNKGYACLHPGAIFQGKQQSGRTNHDVTVTILVSSAILNCDVFAYVSRRMSTYNPPSFAVICTFAGSQRIGPNSRHTLTQRSSGVDTDS